MKTSPEAQSARTQTADRLPEHIGIIMDGNRRWARSKGLPIIMGHKKGADNLEMIARAVRERGIKYLTIFSISTENLKRSADEVDYLMDLHREMIKRFARRLHTEGTRVIFIGRKHPLPDDVLADAQELMDLTADNQAATLIVAMNYGSRAEITDAVKRIVDEGTKSADISEETIADHMYLNDVPDPDLIIRTGGEKRLSNFLLWQASYSELYFSDALWPDFSVADLDNALADFAARERRRGK